MRKSNRSNVRRRIGVAWILLTCTTSSDIRLWGTATAATAFSLASIFPRKTEKAPQQNDLKGDLNVIPLDIKKENPLSEGHTLIPESVSEHPEQLPYQMLSNDMRQERINGEETQSPNGQQQQSSVHLQLQSMHQPHEVEETTNGSPNAAVQSEGSKVTHVRVHSLVDPQTNRTWVALNTSRRKFLAFLECNNVMVMRRNNVMMPTATGHITSSTVVLPEQSKTNGDADCAVRNHWRELWKAQQLITDRTELLAVYQSDNNKDDDSSSTAKSDQQPRARRGGFRDLLNLYSNRLVAILQDEQHDERTPPEARYHSSVVREHQRNRYGQIVADESLLQQNDHRILVKWLEDHYGMSETLMLQARRFRSLPVPAQLELMHHFLEWFRKHFPYYYDRCDSCGASQKDELAAQPPQHDAVDNHIDDDDDDNSTFLGYIYPDAYEIKGKASRTELYQCHKCGSFTRFPRYNSAFDIIQSRRGRCGEYSLLLYRFLRALNHDARWVVDWADHVWAEVLIGDNNTAGLPVGGAKSGIQDPTTTAPRWVHLDPCEAAVDKPLLYEEWGKKQTYIIALYAPLRYQALQVQNRNNQNGFPFLTHWNRWHNGATAITNGHHYVDKTSSLVEDVTQQYTSDSWEDICKRREESADEVISAIQDALKDLVEKLFR